MHQLIRLKFFLLGVVLFIFFLAVGCSKAKVDQHAKAFSVEVKADRLRAKPGERVQVKAVVQSERSLRRMKVSASLFVPTKGAQDLTLQKVQPEARNQAVYQGNVDLDPDAPGGIYGITIQGELGFQRAVGKASFCVGKTVGDFLVASSVPVDNQEEDLRRYFEDFRTIGGNMVIIHDIISEKAWYPSRICAKAAQPGTPEDKVGKALALAQELGLSYFLSVSWDMTCAMPYSEHMKSVTEIVDELWQLYGSSPAMVGFYDYQEGSGTYFASHVREFCAAVKSRSSGLLTACAPYIDDPLLSGYLAAIDDLDVVIYQGAVMASYRPDNRKCFPLRRTKDCTSLSAGATMQKNKITLSHVELFGYMEKSFGNGYLASPDDIRGQILSAATAFGPDGITLFSYHHNIHEMGKSVAAAKESKKGVEEGMKAYRLIAESAASASSRVGVYIPYSDWWLDRWTNCTVPALDAFRKLGVSPEIIPFIPPAGEEILPFYPYHLNKEQSENLLANSYVLILSDIAGMQDTDSILIKEFVEKGGVVLMFGPRIPYGDLFEREELCGGRENPTTSHSRIEVREKAGARVANGTKLNFSPTEFSSWEAVKGTVWAVFEDGRAAVLANESGAGLVITTPLSLGDAVKIIPEYVRDILDHALSSRGIRRPFDILDADEDIDIAMKAAKKESQLAIVNHKNTPLYLRIRPLHLKAEIIYELVDLETGAPLAEGPGKDLAEIRRILPALDYILLSLSEK